MPTDTSRRQGQISLFAFRTVRGSARLQPHKLFNTMPIIYEECSWTQFPFLPINNQFHRSCTTRAQSSKFDRNYNAGRSKRPRFCPEAAISRPDINVHVSTSLISGLLALVNPVPAHGCQNLTLGLSYNNQPNVNMGAYK